MFTTVKDKSVIVTGGSKGIGKGIAKRFAEEGANVLVINRTKEAGEQLVRDFSQMDLTVHYFNADVGDEAQMKAAAEHAERTFCGVDILCINAGVYPSATIETLSCDEWDQVQQTNLKGTFLALKSFLPLIKKSDLGRVILTSSITGPVTGYPGWSHYGATKAGQLGFMKTAAIELSQYGITINAVLPGNIMTESLTDMGEEYIARMERAIPLKRLGSTDDIANTALFLASKEAGYITGQSIIVDGGQTLPESLDALA